MKSLSSIIYHCVSTYYLYCYIIFSLNPRLSKYTRSTQSINWSFISTTWHKVPRNLTHGVIIFIKFIHLFKTYTKFNVYSKLVRVSLRPSFAFSCLESALCFSISIKYFTSIYWPFLFTFKFINFTQFNYISLCFNLLFILLYYI